MAEAPSSESKNKTTESPSPEALRPQSDAQSSAPQPGAAGVASQVSKRPRHATYRPSHKATFIGLAVVVAILAINAGIIMYVIKGQSEDDSEQRSQDVTISPAVLEGLGVSRNPVGNLGTELVVGPDSRFEGKMTVANDVSVGGQLILNSKFSASDASLANLEAGDTSLGQLNVNGDGTMSNLSLRGNLGVTGSTLLQGTVTISQLLTVNNNVNIAGNLGVGGTLSARGFQASSLVSDTTLTIGGHILTRGAAPGVGPGGAALGSNGTVSISGNDAAGTVAANIGTGGGNGILAHVAFRQPYGSTPHVVVTGVGRGMGNLYVNRSVGGFSIGIDGPLAPGGYAIDYIVMQ